MDSQMLERSDDGRPTVHFDELHPTFKGGYRGYTWFIGVILRVIRASRGYT